METYIEHNWVGGQPELLVMDDDESYLTSNECEEGQKLFRELVEQAYNKQILTLNENRNSWVVKK